MRLISLLCSFSLILNSMNAQTSDLELLQFESPGSYGCDYSDSIEVTVLIKNNGTTPRTGFEMTYQINSFIVSTEVVNTTVQPGAVTTFTFKKKVLFTSTGGYNFASWFHDNNGDMDLSNDSVMHHPLFVSQSTIVYTFPYSESFDDTSGLVPQGWVNDPYDEIVGASGSSYQTHDWVFMSSADGIQADRSGTGHMAVLPNIEVWTLFPFETNLVTPCMDLSGILKPALEFYLFNSVQDGSISLYVDVFSGGHWVNIGGPLEYQSEAEWSYFLYDLSAFSGEVIKIRFRGWQPGYMTNDDMGLDDVRVLDRPAINTGIVTGSPSTTDCGLSSNQQIDVVIVNTGYEAIIPGDSVEISYQIDMGVIVTEVYVAGDTISPFDTIKYSFTTTADLSSVNSYSIKTWTTQRKDSDPANDTLIYSVEHLLYVQDYPYVEKFEAGAGGWTAVGEKPSWSLGTPNGSVITGASSGDNAWSTVISGGGYNKSEHSYLLSPCFDFSNLAYPQIAFDIWYECATGSAGAALQYSIDNGYSWHTVGDIGDDINWYTGSVLSSPGGQGRGWSGYQGNGSNRWVKVKHFLQDLGGQQKVRFRVVFASTASGAIADGVAIDNIVIGETPPAPLPSSITGCGFVLLDAGNEAVKVGWSTGDSTQAIAVRSGNKHIQQQVTLYIENEVGLYNVDTVEINLSPGPYVSLGSDTLICESNNYLLDPVFTTGATILWDNNTTTANRMVSDPGSFWLQASAYGCTKRDTIRITFGEGPTSLFDFEQQPGGQIVAFKDSSKLAVSYYWDFGDGSSNILPNPEHLYQDTGTYLVSLVVTNDCGKDTLTKLIVVTVMTGLTPKIVTQQPLKVYPNPTKDRLTLEYEANEFSTGTLDLLDVYGRKIHSINYTLLPGTNRITYSFPPVEPAIYLLRMIVNDSVMTVSVVKE